MSKGKAIVCSIMLLIIICSLLIATMFVDVTHSKTLFDVIASAMAGALIGDKVGVFYRWLTNE